DVDARMVAAPRVAADAVLEPQQRREDVGLAPAAVHPARQHADDGEGLAAERERPAQDLRIAAEAPLPEALAEHGHAGRAGLLVLRLDPAPQDRRPAERRDESRRD